MSPPPDLAAAAGSVGLLPRVAPCMSVSDGDAVVFDAAVVLLLANGKRNDLLPEAERRGLATRRGGSLRLSCEGRDLWAKLERLGLLASWLSVEQREGQLPSLC